MTTEKTSEEKLAELKAELASPEFISRVKELCKMDQAVLRDMCVEKHGEETTRKLEDLLSPYFSYRVTI